MADEKVHTILPDTKSTIMNAITNGMDNLTINADDAPTTPTTPTDQGTIPRNLPPNRTRLRRTDSARHILNNRNVARHLQYPVEHVTSKCDVCERRTPGIGCFNHECAAYVVNIIAS